MAPKQDMEKMELRKNFRNVWHTDLTHSIQNDTPYCCFALWCAPCASYLLRKRALYDDMSRYVCCAGYMPCSGRCGETKCPQLCLATETQHKMEMDKRDGKFGPQPMAVPPAQQMSRFDQAIPPAVGYPPQQGYPPSGYPQHPPQGYPQHPPQGYPPSGYPQHPPPSAYSQYPPGAYPPPAYPK